MNNIESFLSDWMKMSKAHSYKTYLRDYGKLEVQLSNTGWPNTVSLGSIRSSKQKTGEATKFLLWLTKQADSSRFNLRVSVEPFGWDKDDRPGKEKLKEFFERYDFKVQHDLPDEAGYVMIRPYHTKKIKK